MNLYSLLNIEHTSNINVPNAQKIEEILNEILTTRLNKLGLDNKSKKYIWQSDYNAIGIKRIIQFRYRGVSAGFLAGINFKFIPFITEHRHLKHYNYKLHLFESSDYFDSSYNISLWNEKFFRKTLKKYLDKNLIKLLKFLNDLDSIESNILLAQRQMTSNKFQYTIHDPDSKYVLAYLYHKHGNLSESNKMKALYLKEFTDFDDSIFKNLH